MAQHLTVSQFCTKWKAWTADTEDSSAICDWVISQGVCFPYTHFPCTVLKQMSHQSLPIASFRFAWGMHAPLNNHLHTFSKFFLSPTTYTCLIVSLRWHSGLSVCPCRAWLWWPHAEAPRPHYYSLRWFTRVTYSCSEEKKKIFVHSDTLVQFHAHSIPYSLYIVPLVSLLFRTHASDENPAKRSLKIKYNTKVFLLL